PAGPRTVSPCAGSLRQQAEDLLHRGGVVGTGRLRPDVAQRPQVQQGGGGRLLVGGLANDHAVEGPQRPVEARHLDAHLPGRGLERPRPLAGVPDGLDALLREVHGRDEGRHRSTPSGRNGLVRGYFIPAARPRRALALSRRRIPAAGIQWLRRNEGREPRDRMNSWHSFTPGCRPPPCRATVGPWRFVLAGCAVTVLAVMCLGCGNSSSNPGGESGAKAALPEISAFLTKPSDCSLVDVEHISRGHPLLGVNSPHPHGGGHVHFDNSKRLWPRGKDEPARYPAIYAEADGVVGRIDTRLGLPGGNDRYGI